jgi:hypothetical protein
MIDNNLVLLIAIGVVIFLIVNLNSKQDYSKLYKHEGFQNLTTPFQSSSPMPILPSTQYVPPVMQQAPPVMQQAPPVQQPVPPIQANTIVNNLVSSVATATPKPSTDSDDYKSSLQSFYNTNLTGSSGNVASISEPTNFASDYGQGFNLGVNVLDKSLSKYTSQAPVQKPNMTSSDLLPKMSEDWFENPSVGIKVDDANLLADALFKVGVNTVGQTRKNPAYDIRGTIANPKFSVSPWNNSTYEPDNNIKPLC